MAQKPPQRDALDLQEWWDPALRIARQRIQRQAWLRPLEEDLVNFALEKLHQLAQREEVRNPEGFLSVVIQRRIIDLALKRKAESDRLALLVDELNFQKVGSGRGEFRELARRQSLRGLSADIIADEELQLTRLRAAGSIAVMPDAESREILSDRFYADPPLSISDLARLHKKSPNVMSNFLAKVIGSHDEPGAVGPVSDVLRALQLRTAESYVRILLELDGLSAITDPFAGAISHLEYAGSRSKEHRKIAVAAIARVRWLERHFPSNRGIGNKILRRMVTAGCIYVMEERDAHHDLHDPRGLADDLSVLTALFEVVREHSK